MGNDLRYSWILFDADGTLFDFAKAEAKAMVRTFKESGHIFQPAYAETFETINAEMWRAFEQGRISQNELRTTRFERLFESIGIETDAAAFSVRYLGNLAKGTYLIEGAEEIVGHLHGKVSMLIVTNGLADVQRPRFAKSTIIDYFEDCVISEEVGSAKPDSAIFDIAFERMSNPARSDVLMVGDSLTSDITGGIGYGIDVCWFNPEGIPHPPELEIQYEISELGELVGILSDSV
jgi:2-haloacid dehalogenase